MEYKRYFNAKEFYKDTFHILMKHEAQNMLPLGNVILGNQGGEKEGWRNPDYWYMGVVKDNEGNICLSAVMTPPFNITLYETDNMPNDEALIFLCENLINENIDVPGVVSENSLGERFSRYYCEKAGKSYETHQNMRIYTLEKVNQAIPLINKIRKAENKDMCFLPYWNKSFNEDCNLGEITLEESVSAMERAVKLGVLYILEDEGVPVTMASAGREIVHGRGVGLVYTPNHFRKKGYAGACVAQLSQVILDMGYEYAALFTDLANSTSNSLYQKIGYVPVCDYKDIRFYD